MNNSQSYISVFVRNQLKDKICSLCLSLNRHFVKNVLLVKKIQRDFPKLLLDFNDEAERICWECNGQLMKLVRFQNRIKKARDILQANTGSFMPKIVSLSSLKQTALRGNVLIEPASSGITTVEQNKPIKFVQYVPKITNVKQNEPIQFVPITNVNQNGRLQFVPKTNVKQNEPLQLIPITNVKQNEPLQFVPKIVVTSTSSGSTNVQVVEQNESLQFVPKTMATSRMPAISSVSSLSQPAEQGKQNMVPTLTTAPIEIKTEILETDSIDVKQEPSDDETLSIDSLTAAEENPLDLDDILNAMYVQKPQLSLPAYDLTPHTNRAPSHQPLSNKPSNIPVNPDPNRIIVTSGPSQKAPIGRATNANVVVLSRRMVFELRERERIYLNSLKTKFFCDKCVMSLKTESAYIAHSVKHLPETGPTVCDICELRFKKMEHLNLHYKAHFRAYSCGQCRGMAFVCHHWSTMELHLDMHEGACTCDQCGVVFKSKELLKEHKETTHKIVCPQCKLKFVSQASFEEHVRFTHQHVKCQKCNLIMKGLKGLKFHHLLNKDCDTYGADIVMMKAEDGITQSYCSKCNKFFKTRLCLISHLKSRAHSTAWFECDYCGKKYSIKRSLSSHIEFIHMKTGKHLTCDTCGEAFQSKGVLNRHINFVHLKKKLEAKYCCDVCGKAFTSMRMLNNHQRIHSGIRAYQCDLCPWNFTQKSTLQTHMKLKHKKMGANSAAPAATASAANVRKRSAANAKKRKGRKKKK